MSSLPDPYAGDNGVQRTLYGLGTSANVTPLAAAVVVVLALGAFKASRPFAIPVGIVIMALWYFKFKRQGGHL